jgi:hypothetical protein
MPKEAVMRFYNQPHKFYCDVDLHARTKYLHIIDMADPANVFGAASCGRLGWNVAGAADAKESAAIRELRELKEKFLRIPECVY